MAALVNTAEELYEVVCGLQQEQQTTQLELRAIQRRSESLKEKIKEHQDTIANERHKQQDASEKLKTLRFTARLKLAQKEGVALAAQDVMKTLHAEQLRLLHVCLDNVQRGSTSTSIAHGSNKTQLSSSSSDSFLHKDTLQMDNAVSLANLFKEPDNQLYTGVALHALLTILRKKLLKGVQAVDATLKVRQSPESTYNAASTCSGPDPQQQPPLLNATPSDQLFLPSPSPVPSALLSRKRIVFARASSFQRVTPVSASNVNRGVPQPSRRSVSYNGSQSEAGACGAPQGCITLAPTAGAPAPRSVTKFTVRVASRSSTLIAEAAALGAKRQRATQLTRDDAQPLSLAPSAAHPCRDGSCGDPPGAVSGVPLSNERDTACPMEVHDGDVAWRCWTSGPLACGPRVSGSAGSGPRRTVWTWTRDTTEEKLQ